MAQGAIVLAGQQKGMPDFVPKVLCMGPQVPTQGVHSLLMAHNWGDIAFPPVQAALGRQVHDNGKCKRVLRVKDGLQIPPDELAQLGGIGGPASRCKTGCVLH